MRFGDEAGQAIGQSDVEVSWLQPRLDAIATRSFLTAASLKKKTVSLPPS